MSGGLLQKSAKLIENGDHAVRYALDSKNRNEYVGRAVPGTLTSEAKWAICFYTYDRNSDRVLTITWANGTNDYSAIWDDRETLNYS